jgi:hypothetical protein
VHPVCFEKFLRKVLPEHEKAFWERTPSRRLLEQAFVRLGAEARTYYEGLKGQRGRGAGYHLQRILRLADRHGAQVVCGAMAHAARYGNYGADAVARIIAGRPMPRSPSGPSAPAVLPPERVRRWLRGMDVEQKNLSDYDARVERAVGGAGDGSPHPAARDDTEEESDGET